MPRRYSKRKASASDDDGVDDSAVEKSAKGPRRAVAKQTRQDINHPRQRSIRPTNIPSTSRKRKTGMGDLKNQLQKQGDELVDFIEKQLETPRGSRSLSKAAVDEQLAPDLTSVVPWISIAPTSPSPTTAPPPQSIERAFDELYSIIDTYENMNVKNTGIKKPSWMRWKEDGRDLAELNERVMGFAAQSAEYSVMSGRHGPISGPSKESGDIERMSWEMVEQGIPKTGEETWGMAAQRHVKTFTDILEALPSEKRGIRGLR